MVEIQAFFVDFFLGHACFIFTQRGRGPGIDSSAEQDCSISAAFFYKDFLMCCLGLLETSEWINLLF